MDYIDLDKYPGISRLYSHYALGIESAQQLFQHSTKNLKPESALISGIHNRDYSRQMLAEVLDRQNRQLNAHDNALENIDKLRDQSSLAVVTGQQVGLLGGPLYSTYKALHTISLAAQLERDLGHKVVPIFWLELEDHDIEEINQASARLDGEYTRLTINQDLNQKNIPVKDIALGEGVESFLETIQQGLIHTEFSDTIFQDLRQFYQSEHSYSKAFGLLFSHLFSRLGLVFADPSDVFFKNQAKSVFSYALEKPFNQRAEFIQHQQKLESASYHLQVKQADDRIGLFLMTRDGKQNVWKENDNYSLGDRREQISESDLCEIVDKAPERLVPSVLTRPLVQDSIFPTVAYVAGPAEVSYWAQTKPLYEGLGIPQPVVIPRAGFTIISGAAKKHLKKLDLSVVEILQPFDELTEKMINTWNKVSPEVQFDLTNKKINEALISLQRELAPDSTEIDKAVKITSDKISFYIGKLQERLVAELKRKNDTLINRLQTVATFLYPEQKPQERTYTIIEFLNMHGEELIDELYKTIDPMNARHYLITL